MGIMKSQYYGPQNYQIDLKKNNGFYCYYYNSENKTQLA